MTVFKGRARITAELEHCQTLYSPPAHPMMKVQTLRSPLILYLKQPVRTIGHMECSFSALKQCFF